MPLPESNASSSDVKITWVSSATGERFPVKVNTQNAIWQQFLDSESMSPSNFLKALLASPKYFQSPAPWNSNSRLAQRVTDLLDSFRPGSYSYRPFKRNRENVERSGHQNEDQNNNNNNYVDINNNDNSNLNNHPAPRLNRFISEETRRRVYVDLGRPRPFYRRSRSDEPSRSEQQTRNMPNAQCQNHQREPKSLRETVRNHLVKAFGLDRFRSLLDSPEIGLPGLVRKQMLTFTCDDFEEIQGKACDPMMNQVWKTGSYKVRCVIDGLDYIAVFAASEVDKHVSNLWNEFGSWIQVRDQFFIRILALAADPLTENVFFIFQDRYQSIIDKNDSICNRVRTKLSNHRPDFEAQLCSEELPMELALDENVFIDTKDNCKVIFQNPLLISKTRLSTKSDVYDENKAKVIQEFIKYLESE